MNRLRFRSGYTELHKLRVDSDTVIAAGDLVWLDEDDVKPASNFPWDSNLAATQTAFAAVFLGVAHQHSADGDTAPVSVDLSPLSIYEFDVNPATYEVGDVLGPDESSSTLMSQQLEAIPSDGAGIARAAEYKASASTLRVSFASAYHPASANQNAQIG